jgi:hypothetical protein
MEERVNYFYFSKGVEKCNDDWSKPLMLIALFSKTTIIVINNQVEIKSCRQTYLTVIGLLHAYNLYTILCKTV